MAEIHTDNDPEPRDGERLTTADLAAAAGGTDRLAEPRAFGEGVTRPADGEASPLFRQEEAQTFHDRWTSIQAGFVDEPRRAVEEADSLVADAIKRLAEMFAEERSGLERQWDRGDEVSTEDLRQALRRYRSFFGRLLAV